MVPHQARGGSRTAGLVYYLYGPGKRDEHHDPHMVAAWDDSIIVSRDPSRSANATVPALARLLDAPVDALEGKRPKQHVFHVPVRLDPGDRELSDDEWNHVAREIMDAAGIAPKGKPESSCRWIAVRHADDHIHIVATLATEEGKKPDLWRSKAKMQDRARQLEKHYGIRRLASGDKTAKKWPTQGELAKAERMGRDEAPRATLQAKVREAAAAARNEPDFFSRLSRAGLRVQQRIAPDGNVTGYSVALPGDRTSEDRAVWYSGSRLAPDLSLPRVRERWSDSGTRNLTRPATRAEAWQQAATQVEQAAEMLSRAGDTEGAGIVAALGDALTTYSADAPRMVRQEIKEAAQAFERAARAPEATRASSQARQHLSNATQSLVLGGMMASAGSETAAAIALMHALLLAAIAAHRWHEARRFRMQAEGARTAVRHLRAAAEMTRGAASGTTGRRPSKSSTKGLRPVDGPQVVERYTSVVREVVPEHAEAVLSDEAWPALAATIKKAEDAGYRPTTVLSEVVSQRELGSADNVAQVLTWRLQGRMRGDEAGRPDSAATKLPKTAEKRPTKTPASRRTEHRRPPQDMSEKRPRGPGR